MIWSAIARFFAMRGGDEYSGSICKKTHRHAGVLRFCHPAVLLAAALTLGACTTNEPAPRMGERVEISVVSSFGGDDGHRKVYEDAVRAYESASGNVIKDTSATADEDWKAKIMADFEAGAEPDVLFYFTGADSNSLIKSGKVVSIDEIRAIYPAYAANMREEMLAASPVDGKPYAVPVSGYLEVMFVNRRVLASCGLEIPDATYTWERFLEDCAVIKENGYTPIACSLRKEPHYWFEFLVYNRGNASNHLELPKSSQDEVGQKWAAGLNDIKTLYELGFFPRNTNTSTEVEANQLFLDDKAAFMANGSWKIGWFNDNSGDNINRFAATFFPGSESRAATDTIGGFSMGYFITRKAWENPEKQAACVEFVQSMTTNENIVKFSTISSNALAIKTPVPPAENAFEKSLQAVADSTTSMIGAVQDTLSQSARGALFSYIPDIVTGDITAEEALDNALVSDS